jgi:hypothetical protein
MDIHQMICAYYDALAGNPHHRYGSWEHCYGFFQRTTRARLNRQRDQAALQLGFYLASWGMYRNSFLLNYTYTVHLDVVDCLASQAFAALWEADVGSEPEHDELAETILSAITAIREAYCSYGAPTDALVTKVLLGTLGCLPACDRFFIDGFRRSGFQYAYLNNRFIDRVLQFCTDHVNDLREEQARIADTSMVTYPFMKLVAMCFWQIGYENRPTD